MADVSLIGKWQWDYELRSYPDYFELNVNFNSGGDTYVKATYEPTTGLMYFDADGNYDSVYTITDSVGTWYHDEYRTIEITSGADENSAEKLNILRSVATFIPLPPTEDLKYPTIEALLIGVADAIRVQKGVSTKFNKQNLPNEILSIAGGGTPIEIETLNSELLTEDNIGKVYKLNDNMFIVKQFPEYIRFENVKTGETYDAIPYLTLSSPEQITVSLYKNWDGTLEYSTNTTDWYEWDGSEITSGYGNNIYLRGTNNTKITEYSEFEFNDVNIYCKGNIENLLDYQKVMRGEHPIMGEYCFSRLFRDCTTLIEAPELHATTLADYCYQEMFNGCTSLTTAPKLPATTLAYGCYRSMFEGCTSLTTAPKLLAIVLTDVCYQYMFMSCTSLTTPPELPAVSLAYGCYQEMFDDCQSLIKAPELPATALADYCYDGMFSDCTSLTTAPELPATTLAIGCYQSMFRRCTSLTQAPILPGSILFDMCYAGMFNGCTSLETLPIVQSNTLHDQCCFYMFAGCTKIKLSTTQTEEYKHPYIIPVQETNAWHPVTDMFKDTGGTFTGTPEINTLYYTSNTVMYQ